MNKPTDGTESLPGGSKAAAEGEPPPRKTPLYAAIHASRNQRQLLIKEIQRLTGRKVICYVAGPQASVDRDDTPGFVDLLHNISANADLDLVLHTGGGDIDAAKSSFRWFEPASVLRSFAWSSPTTQRVLAL